MKRILAILLTVVAVFTVEANAITRDELQRYDVVGLLPFYYGDLQYDIGFSLLRNKNPDAFVIREELIARPGVTEALMTEFRRQRGNDSLFCYSLLGLGEFGDPGEQDQQFVLSVIKEVFAKREQYRATKPELITPDGMVLAGMGAYLAGRPSAEGEPILLAILRDTDWNYALPYTLRMVERHPTRARLDALRSRDYESLLAPSTAHKGLYAQIKSSVDASTVRIEARLRESEGLQPSPQPKSEPTPAKAPDATSPEVQQQERAAYERDSPADPSSQSGTLWLVSGLVTLLLLIVVFVRQLRR